MLSMLVGGEKSGFIVVAMVVVLAGRGKLSRCLSGV